MKPLKQQISITIDSDVLEELKQKADYNCRPLSQYINLILKRFLEQQKKNPHPHRDLFEDE